MEIVGTRVHEEKNGVTVEFLGERGNVVTVHMTKNEDGHLNRVNAEQKAKAVMVQIATFDKASRNRASLQANPRWTTSQNSALRPPPPSTPTIAASPREWSR